MINNMSNIENNTANLSELSQYFPNRDCYEIVKDTLLQYFSHLDSIKVKILKAYLQKYSVVLKENYKIEENFEELHEILEKYKGWFVDLNK